MNMLLRSTQIRRVTFLYHYLPSLGFCAAGAGALGWTAVAATPADWADATGAGGLRPSCTLGAAQLRLPLRAERSIARFGCRPE